MPSQQNLLHISGNLPSRMTLQEQELHIRRALMRGTEALDQLRIDYRNYGLAYYRVDRSLYRLGEFALFCDFREPFVQYIYYNDLREILVALMEDIREQLRLHSSHSEDPYPYASAVLAHLQDHMDIVELLTAEYKIAFRIMRLGRESLPLRSREKLMADSEFVGWVKSLDDTSMALALGTTLEEIVDRMLEAKGDAEDAPEIDCQQEAEATLEAFNSLAAKRFKQLERLDDIVKRVCAIIEPAPEAERPQLNDTTVNVCEIVDMLTKAIARLPEIEQRLQNYGYSELELVLRGEYEIEKKKKRNEVYQLSMRAATAAVLQSLRATDAAMFPSTSTSATGNVKPYSGRHHPASLLAHDQVDARHQWRLRPRLPNFDRIGDRIGA
ncbi:hypothetical protein K505DRAFT_336890 [Melanomma pulvis-pyrius CBS 109.77]|uniref:Uncharacterized protein n=1 Tax=Melanomma pulvis-pyrius CBS 109.77 TaxID=1314802 RepID=A0A6A6XDC0_9PLEO|nr:hypothetical protein K505DRAFT_336890 [Melanomma pulvis-pyrius CBS 109.77]